MMRRRPSTTLFPTRRSSDLIAGADADALQEGEKRGGVLRGLLDVEAEEDELVFLPGVAAVPVAHPLDQVAGLGALPEDRKSTRLNSSHGYISYAVFCLKPKS